MTQLKDTEQPPEAASAELKTTDQLPPRMKTVPFPDSVAGLGLRLCLVVRDEPDAVKGYFVFRRHFPGGKVFLGCLTDSGGRIHEWVEIWVQTTEGLRTSTQGEGAALTNAEIDERWKSQSEVIERLGSDSSSGEVLLRTGWERVHPPPLFYDPQSRSLMHPRCRITGASWELCQDDALLTMRRLEPFSSTKKRFLYTRKAGEEPRFVDPFIEGDAKGAALPPSEAFENGPQLVPINPEGGFLMVTRWFPLSYETAVDLIGGKPWSEIRENEVSYTLGRVDELLERASTDRGGHGYLFWGHHGKTGWLLEVLYLKLALLAEAARAIRHCVEQQRAPLMNVSTESFRVRLNPVGAGLPFLWTTELTLAKPGHSVRITLPDGTHTSFTRGDETDVSGYFPRGIEDPQEGFAQVVVLEIVPSDAGKVVLRGTLRTRMALEEFSVRDLLDITLPIQGRPEPFHGRMTTDVDRQPGQYHFQSYPKKISPALADALNAACNSTFERVRFCIVPTLSSPCDLYALSVLALRTLLVTDTTSVRQIVDEILDLAQLIKSGEGQPGETAARITKILEQDLRQTNPRWLPILGPHRLVSEEINSVSALRLVPIEIWAEVMAFIIRLRPGLAPDGYCADYADAPAEDPTHVFDEPLRELDALLVRTRSLLFVDWSFTREIHQIIEEVVR